MYTRSISLVLAAAACSSQPAAPPADRAQPALRLAAEDIVTITRGTLSTGPRISGSLTPSSRSIARAEAPGSVVAIGPELGDAVKKGDLLARIEVKALGDAATSARSGVTAAQAQLDLARREVQRIEALVTGGALAQRELDRARSQLTATEASVTQARAQLAASQSQLGDAVARAPFGGVIARRAVNVGDVVLPGAELYEVIDPSTMRLEASVASDDLSVVGPGKAVDFAVRGYPGQKFAGKISRIAPAADPVTRQIQVLIEIPNPGNKLIAGLYAEGRVAAAAREAVTAPLAAIDASGDQPSVLRVKAGVVERVVVALGLRDERAELAEITSGLAAGDVVLLARAGRSVIPGAKVELPAQPAAGAASAPGSAAGSAAAVEKR
jgi:membrane fusion protein (multidrug efflux system)